MTCTSTSRRYDWRLNPPGNHLRNPKNCPTAWGHFYPLVVPRSGAARRLCDAERGIRADHRVSLRARARDAEVGDGRERPGRDERRPLPQCRGAGDAAPDRHAYRRQDGDADAPTTGVRGGYRGRTVRRGGGAAHRGEHRRGQRASACERNRRGGARPRPAAREGGRVRVDDRHRRARHGRGRAVAFGNTGLLREVGGDPAPVAAEAERLRAEGASVVYLAIDGRLAGALAVHDPVNESTPAAIETLHRAGIRVTMAPPATVDRRPKRSPDAFASTKSTARCARRTRRTSHACRRGAGDRARELWHRDGHTDRRRDEQHAAGVPVAAGALYPCRSASSCRRSSPRS